jgi:cyclopropane fatty-acyl-phospholipid synthase-like methyltransferase
MAYEVVDYLELHSLLNKPISILDYGCGNGEGAKFVAEKTNYQRYTCMDISKKAIEASKKSCRNLHYFEFLLGDITNITKSYDIIIVSAVYHFLSKEKRSMLIEKIKQFLNPDGLVFLLTLSTDDKQYYGKGRKIENTEDPDSFISDEGYYLHFSSKKELLTDFNFLRTEKMTEFFGKNYTNDKEFFTCWILIGKSKKKEKRKKKKKNKKKIIPPSYGTNSRSSLRDSP